MHYYDLRGDKTPGDRLGLNRSGCQCDNRSCHKTKQGPGGFVHARVGFFRSESIIGGLFPLNLSFFVCILIAYMVTVGQWMGIQVMLNGYSIHNLPQGHTPFSHLLTPRHHRYRILYRNHSCHIRLRRLHYVRSSRPYRLPQLLIRPQQHDHIDEQV